MKKLTLESDIFTRGVADIITRKELAARLKEGRALRIKHGIDPTGNTLHLGHAANLWKIRALQEAGHKAVLLWGDTTAKIGDPTGKEKARPLLPAVTVAANINSLRKQVRSILSTDPQVYEEHKSSEWYGKMYAPELINVLSLVTHAKLIERDMFQRRIRAGSEISLQELIYPLLQGYDSVKLRADLTVAGQDQLFNEHMGRFLQEKFGQHPQAIVALSILPGLGGGEKMSKSSNNYIGLTDSPRDKFGKAMRLADALIIPYLSHYTDVSPEQIKELERGLKQGKNPRDAKLFLAQALVRRYHGQATAEEERARFVAVFSRHQVPADVQEVKLPAGHSFFINQLLVRLKMAGSLAEARRLILAGAVKIDGAVVKNPKMLISPQGALIRAGKRKIAKIV